MTGKSKFIHAHSFLLSSINFKTYNSSNQSKQITLYVIISKSNRFDLSRLLMVASFWPTPICKISGQG